jgi:hypothetical protein
MASLSQTLAVDLGRLILFEADPALDLSGGKERVGLVEGGPPRSSGWLMAMRSDRHSAP